MPRSAPETLNNGEQSLDFTYYEQTTNRFWSPHLAESRVLALFIFICLMILRYTYTH
jgi:hypothetical protein